jgi:hypothetical protein
MFFVRSDGFGFPPTPRMDEAQSLRLGNNNQSEFLEVP